MRTGMIFAHNANAVKVKCHVHILGAINTMVPYFQKLRLANYQSQQGEMSGVMVIGY